MLNRKKDWQRAEIICALRLTGTSMRGLSIASGLAPTTLNEALRKKWPKGERIIAAAIGVDASEIWPSRYSEQ